MVACHVTGTPSSRVKIVVAYGNIGDRYLGVKKALKILQNFLPCLLVVFMVCFLKHFFCSLYFRKEVRAVICYCECFPLILRAVLRLLKHLIKALLCLGAAMGR